MRRNSERILTEWLVLNAQSGKTSALDQLLRLWYPEFLRYSTYQLRDREAAKDVVQDACLTVAKQIGRLKDPIAFPKWAYRILHRRGVDYQRKEIRRRRYEVPDNNPDSAVSTGIEPDVEDDTGHAIRDALSGLSELSYNVIHLHYLHGLSVREIATIWNIPDGTVKSRLHTARGKLRNLLAEKP